MTKPELPRCECGRALTRRDVERGFKSCSIACGLREQARLLDASAARAEPTDDEALDGLLALKREEESKR